MLLPCRVALSSEFFDMTNAPAPIRWMRTRELLSYLGIHRNTLGNMIRSGLLRDGIHRRKINPLSPRGEFLWNYEAVLMTLGLL